MEYSSKDLISADEILSEVLPFTGEKRLESVTKGFIYMQMNNCLEELSYDTFFQDDTRPFDIPPNRMIDIPPLVFNIRQMWLYSGDSCNFSDATNVYHKRNYFHNGGSEGFQKNSFRDNHNDPFYGHDGTTSDRRSVPQDVYRDGTDIAGSNLFYYGYNNGRIFFSPSCAAFSSVMIKFNGIWQLDTGTPCVPRFLRRVLVDYCTVAVYKAKVHENPALYRTFLLDAESRLDRDGMRGSWYNAEVRVSRLGSKHREDLYEYLSRLNY